MFSNNVGAAGMRSYESMPLQTRSGIYSSRGFAPTAPALVYAGKWTLEEERYVTYLCAEFKAGALDVPEGKSLRCFLAEQLGCNAKRISKKYERTGYHGKLQYVDRRSTITPEELQQRQQERIELERKFKQSRETLKLVEASRKRSGPATAFPEPAHKRPKTVLLTSVTPRLLSGSSLGFTSPLTATTPLGLNGLGANPTSVMESLWLRRALLARQQSQAQSMDILRASTLSAIQKYGSPRPTPAVLGGSPPTAPPHSSATILAILNAPSTASTSVAIGLAANNSRTTGNKC